MATLTIADLDNGKRDLETVDGVANSRAASVTTRRGDQTTTLYEAIRRINAAGDVQLAEQKAAAEEVIRGLGFEVPEEYASGLSVDKANFTVHRDGIIYAPNPDEIPFTTGAWDPSQWYVVQNTESTNQIYWFSSLSAAQAAAAILPEQSAIIVDGVSQGNVLGGAYVASAGTPVPTFSNYTELSSYAGPSQTMLVTGFGIEGLFRVIPGDVTSPSDGGTIFVLSDGRRVTRTEKSIVNAAWFNGAPNSLQLAVNASGQYGAVLIPENYVGTDTYSNPHDIQVIDLRKLGTVSKLGVHSIIAPSEGGQLFPLGHDLVLRSCGPADTYIEHVNATCTTDTPLNVGVNNNVLISEVRIGSELRGVLRTTDSSCLSEYGGFWVNRDEPDEEYIGPDNYSIVDGNHINITCSKSHSGKTYIEQCGSTLLASRDLFISAHSVKSEKSTGFNPPVNVKDLHGDLVFTWPSDLGSPFPHSAFAIAPIMTGANGPEKHMFYQHRQTDSRIYWRNNINEIIASFNNAGQMEYRTGGVSIGGPSVTNGVDGVIQIGRSSFSTTVPASDSDSFIEWSESGANAMNPQGGAGNLLLYSSAFDGSELVLGTQKAARVRISREGVGFSGANPSKPNITGGKGDNVALSNLLNALEGMGLIVNSTT